MFIQYVLLFFFRFVKLPMRIIHSNLEVYFTSTLADRHAIPAQSYVSYLSIWIDGKPIDGTTYSWHDSDTNLGLISSQTN